MKQMRDEKEAKQKKQDEEAARQAKLLE